MKLIRWCSEGLFRKLGLLLLAGMTGLCVLQFAFGYWGGIRYFDETAQREYFTVAAHVANEVQPLLDSWSFDEGAVRKIFSEVERQNPMLRGYLADSRGEIRAASVAVSELSRSRVSVPRLEEALTFELPQFPLEVEEPRLNGGRRVFAVERVRVGKEQGYLLLTMFPPVAEGLRNGGVEGQGVGALFRLLAPAFLFTSVVTIAGLFLLTRYFSRRFRDFVSAANELGAGNYEAELPLGSSDTLGELAERFNRMKESIARKDMELLERERRRRMLLANVSHDLRVPIAIIKGFVELLRKESGKGTGGEVERHHVLSLRRNVERQRGFLTNLEELAQFECDPGDRELSSFSLVECVCEVKESLEGVAREGGVGLEVADELGSERIRADRLWVERLLQNLISNGLRYTPRGGSVRVELGRESGGVCIRVRDTGLGIPEESVPQLFEEFYRVPRSAAEEDPGGTGLGLAIVKRIVDFHQGKIQVESELGKGTTFTVLLPLAPDIPLQLPTQMQQGIQLDHADHIRPEEPAPPAAKQDDIPGSGQGAGLAYRACAESRWERLRTLLTPKTLDADERTMLQRVYLGSAIATVLSLIGLGDVARLTSWNEVIRLAAWIVITVWVVLVGRRAPNHLGAGLGAALLAALFVFCRSIQLGVCLVIMLGLAGALLRRVYRSALDRAVCSDLLWTTLLGVQSAISLFLLSVRPRPAYTLVAVIVCMASALSFLALRRSLLSFISVILPLIPVLLLFSTVYERDEPLIIGVIVGMLMGAVLVSVFYQRHGKRIEMRIAVFIGVAVQGAAFIETYQVIRAWRTLQQQSVESHFAPLVERLRHDLAQTLDTQGEREAIRVLGRFIIHFPAVHIARIGADGKALDRNSSLMCMSSPSCWVREWIKYNYRSAPITISPGMQLYRNDRELSSVFRLEIPVAHGPPQELVFKAPLDGRINRTIESVYGFVATLFGVLSTLAFAYVLRFAVKSQVTRRLIGLSEAMTKLESGEERAVIECRSGDEIDRLGTTLQSMADALSSRRSAVTIADSRRRELVLSIIEALRAPMSSLEQAITALERSQGSIANESAPSKAAQQPLQLIGEIAEQQISVVDDLFLLSKLEIAEKIDKEELTSFDELLEEVAERLIQPPDGVQVKVDLKEGLPFLMMNLSYFSRALAECIIEAGGEGAEVQVTASCSADSLRLDLVPVGDERKEGIEPSRISESGSRSLRITLAERIIILHGGVLLRDVPVPGALRIRLDLAAAEPSRNGLTEARPVLPQS